MLMRFLHQGVLVRKQDVLHGPDLILRVQRVLHFVFSNNVVNASIRNCISLSNPNRGITPIKMANEATAPVSNVSRHAALLPQSSSLANRYFHLNSRPSIVIRFASPRFHKCGVVAAATKASLHN